MKPLPFLEAIAFAKKQGVVLPSEYYGERIGLARAQARTISGLAGVDQIQHIFDILDKHLASGGSFKSFQNAIAENALSGGLPKHRLELIYRNNIQTAYSAGRWQQVERNKDSRPYLRYIAVNDGRTRPSHRAMHGHIAKVDDGWWNTHMPQNGHRCRCTVQSLSEKQAKARGYPNKTPSAKPDKGWDYNAGKTPMQGLQESAKQKKKAVNPVLKKAVDSSIPATSDDFVLIGEKLKSSIETDVSNYDGYMLELMQKIGKQRVIGGIDINTSAKSGKGLQSLRAISDILPRDWIEQSNNSGAVHIKFKKAARGWHLFCNRDLEGKRVRIGGGFGVRRVAHGESYILTGSFSTSLHEYIHRIQSIRPDIDRFFQEEHRNRTAGDNVKRLRDLTDKNYGFDEVAREDSYANPYFGKEYVGKGAIEVMTMAFEYLLGGDIEKFKAITEKDQRMTSLIIGVMINL